MKTIIQVYSLGYINNPNSFHGIGDFVRSTIGLFYFCKKNNFKLLVDFSLHPIGEFLEATQHEYSSFVKSQKNKINLVNEESSVLDFLKMNNSDVSIFFAWFALGIFDKPITKEAKEFVQKMLTPNKIMKDYIDEAFKKIPFETYNIIHYRLGDKDLVKGTRTDYNFYLNHLIQHMEPNSILMSDSKKFKDLVKKNNFPIFMLDGEICHLGLDNDSSSVKDTLVELFIIMKAEKVKSYSVYSWHSGFVHTVCFVHSIPFESHIHLLT
jgi:hypothetical protein